MTSLTWFLLGVVVTLAGVLVWSRISGFPAQRPADYAGQTPAFDLRTHLSGSIKCEGVIYGPLGRVASRFVGDFDAPWDGNRGVMKEHFLYDTGTTQDREWRLEIGNDDRIKAEADDVVGTGQGRECRTQLRGQPTHKGPTAPHHVLPHAGLGLVNPQADGVAQGRSPGVLWQSLFV